MKMEKEFNLSEKIEENQNWSREQIEDVKEAVRLLKEELGVKSIGSAYAEEIIDKIFGDKLNGTNE